MLSEEMKKRSFWKSVFRIGVPCFFLFGIMHLIMRDPVEIFSGGFLEVLQRNFGGNNWIVFLSLTLLSGFLGGLVLTTYNLEEERKEKEEQFR